MPLIFLWTSTNDYRSAKGASTVSTCFIVYLIAVIMYRLFLCHYSLLVDEKNELYHSLLLKVIMLYKY